MANVVIIAHTIDGVLLCELFFNSYCIQYVSLFVSEILLKFYRRTKLHILGYGARANKICQGFESNCAKVYNLGILQISLDLQLSYSLILCHAISQVNSFHSIDCY